MNAFAQGLQKKGARKTGAIGPCKSSPAQVRPSKPRVNVYEICYNSHAPEELQTFRTRSCAKNG
jgi:hypothetical protein